MKELTEYKVYSVPMTQVWVDVSFNHRQKFDNESVIALARSINDTKLETPVCVQPWSGNPGYCYRLIVGFRRFAACRLLHWTEIPAFVTDDDLTEFEAHKMNFCENLQRKELNILEEATAIRQLFPLGETAGVVAKELHQSRAWAHRRLGLLDLPYEVQLMFAADRLEQRDLDVLLPLRKDGQAALTAAKRLLEARETDPDQVASIQTQLKRGRFVQERRRTKDQIAKMISLMFQAGIDGLPTRVAAWCAGTITTEMLLADIKKCRK